MIKINELIQGEISSLAFGGAGILRFKKFVVFVPFTAIGDQIEARITKISKNFAVASLSSLTTQSPDRVTPRCPYFGICPGCQLQHLSANAQNSYKESTVHETLQRIGKVSTQPLSFQEAIKKWEYRRYIKLTLRSNENAFKIGYIAEDNKSLLEITCCPIFLNETNPILQELRDFIQSLDAEGNQEGSVTLFKAGKSFIFLFKFEMCIPKNFIPLIKTQLSKLPYWQGVLLQHKKKTLSFGDTSVSFDFQNLSISSSPQAFVQTHPEQSALLYQKILDHISNKKIQKVLDLYCGIGITSLVLAKAGIQVIGIEKNSTAIKLANQNMKANKIQNALFVQGAVEQKLKQVLTTFDAECMIINPPRIGVDAKVIEAIKHAAVRELIYVSCMPSTLARDVRLLEQEGFKIQDGKVFDMFPQTSHVETLLILSRNPSIR